jgi:hypothetical protein
LVFSYPLTVTLKQKVFVAAYLDKDSDTFGNGTKAALKAYNSSSKEVAAVVAADNLRKPNLVNYLEEQAAAMGIGIKVRLSNYAEIAAARTPRRTVTKVYKRDKDTGNMILDSEIVRDVPVKDADRNHAMRAIDSITGLREQREVDKVTALRESDDLFRRIVGMRARAHVREVGSDDESGSPAPGIQGDSNIENKGHIESTITMVDKVTYPDAALETTLTEDNMTKGTDETSHHGVSKSRHSGAGTGARVRGETGGGSPILSTSSSSRQTKKGIQGVESISKVRKNSAKVTQSIPEGREVVYDAEDIARFVLKEMFK